MEVLPKEMSSTTCPVSRSWFGIPAKANQVLNPFGVGNVCVKDKSLVAIPWSPQINFIQMRFKLQSRYIWLSHTEYRVHCALLFTVIRIGCDLT